MSNQLPGITLNYFLSGQQFYIHNLPSFIYRFSSDDATNKRGILLSEQNPANPKPVNNIHQQGFTMIVINKPMDVKFSSCHYLSGKITRTDLLKEVPFIYRGSFTPLEGKQLQFNRANNTVTETKNGLNLAIQTIQDEKFAVFMPGFGRIGIFYHECEFIADNK